MGRLFLSKREIDFMNDIAKEIVKDVIGQKIYYFPISIVKTSVHDVYEEAQDKIFDNPIELDALVKYEPQDIKSDRFGTEEYYSIEVYVQSKDLIDKNISVQEGDFFSYGKTFFEVIKAPDSDTIYGQIEHKSFVTISGRQARKRQFLAKIFGPKGEQHTDKDAIQDTFVQQRGFDSNKLGKTNDVRDLRKAGVLEDPITGPKEVSKEGTASGAKSSFYDES